MDYISLIIQDVNIDRLLNLSFLQFKLEELHREVRVCNKVAKYHYCKIIVSNNGLVRFKGSFHQLFNSFNEISFTNDKFKNSKGFNGNSFSYVETLSIITHLENLFDVSRKSMTIRSFEFGFNLLLKFFPNKFINGLLFHRGKEFEFRYNRNFSRVLHENYSLKIYNKGEQFMLNKNLMRVELKVSKMVEVRKINFKTLEDFTSENYQYLCNHLLKRFREVNYFDHTIDYSRLNKKDLKLVSDYKNSQYWIKDLKSNHRDRHKKRLHSLIRNHSENLLNIIEKSLIFEISKSIN